MGRQWVGCHYQPGNVAFPLPSRRQSAHEMAMRRSQAAQARLWRPLRTFTAGCREVSELEGIRGSARGPRNGRRCGLKTSRTLSPRSRRQHAFASDMAADRGTGIGERGEALAIKAHDMKFHGEKSKRIVPWHQNPHGYAGIFDDLFVHIDCRTRRPPDCLLKRESATCASHSSATAGEIADHQERRHMCMQFHGNLLSGFRAASLAMRRHYIIY